MQERLAIARTMSPEKDMRFSLEQAESVMAQGQAVHAVQRRGHKPATLPGLGGAIHVITPRDRLPARLRDVQEHPVDPQLGASGSTEPSDVGSAAAAGRSNGRLQRPNRLDRELPLPPRHH
jgi:hypothetical protein